MAGVQSPVQGPFDVGLQPERTWLAWTRTGLAFAANGALILRLAPQTRLVTLTNLIGAALIAAGAVTWVYGRRLYARRDADLRSGQSVARPIALRLIWIIATASALATSALALSTLLTDLP